MKPSLMLLGALCLLSVAAQAQQKAPAQAPAPPPPVNPRDACKADMQSFCASVQPGHGRMRRCLNEHRSALSPACREALPKAVKPAPKHLMPKPQPAPSST